MSRIVSNNNNNILGIHLYIHINNSIPRLHGNDISTIHEFIMICTLKITQSGDVPTYILCMGFVFVLFHRSIIYIILCRTVQCILKKRVYTNTPLYVYICTHTHDVSRMEFVSMRPKYL